MESNPQRQAGRIALLYLVFGVVWIFTSDLIAEQLVSDPSLMRRVQTMKGWLFVALGTGLFYLLVYRYASRQEAAVRRVRRSEDRLKRAQEIARLGSWEYDLRTDELYWSEEIYHILGIEPEDVEVSREAYHRFVHPEDLEQQKEAEDAAFRGEDRLDNDHRIVRPDGEVRYVHERAAVDRDEEGEPIRLLATVQDFTDRKRLEIALERSRNLLRDYARRLVGERERERADLAREIHDHLGQLLTAVKIQLDRQLAGGEEPDVEGIRESVGLVQEGIEEVRDIARSLRPPELDQLGLVDALSSYVSRFEERTGVPTSFGSELGEVPLDRSISIHVYRIVQEALTNVARHAGADRAAVRVESAGVGIRVRVLDDGVGFGDRVREVEGSHGVVGMRERARIFRGDFEIRNREEGGTEVRVQVPLEEGGER